METINTVTVIVHKNGVVYHQINHLHELDVELWARSWRELGFNIRVVYDGAL